MQNFDQYTEVNQENWMTRALESLKKEGVVVLRNLLESKTIDKINFSSNKILSKPNILGAPGYYQTDPFKKTYDAFLLGEEVINAMVNEKIINLIETYTGDKILICGTFLKHDIGANEVYFPYHRHTGVDLTKWDKKNRPYGCGVLLYLHDTEEGAFCYSLGSHKLSLEENDVGFMDQHPNLEELKNNLKRINGKAGDIIIFDENGFHGPEQPTKKPRTVILSDYQLAKYTNNKTRNAYPVVMSDLKNLTSTQLRCMGLGTGTNQSYEDLHFRKFDDRKDYKKIKKVIENKMFLSLMVHKIKHKIKSIIK